MPEPDMQPTDWPEIEGTVDAFAIYERPLDYPNHFVVRRFFALRGGELAADVVPRIAATLEEARRYIPEGRVRTPPRSDTAEANIIEVWV